MAKSKTHSAYNVDDRKQKTDLIEDWLAEHSLSVFADKIKENGITDVQHLQDAEEKDVKFDFGMPKFQAKRLLRAFQKWKKASEQERAKRPMVNPSTFVTNKQSVVVTLSPAFQGFFGMRDGGKSVIVSPAVLEKKWNTLWYKNALNPFQRASNSFIL